jgi:hypothetical protein
MAMITLIRSSEFDTWLSDAKAKAQDFSAPPECDLR